MKGTTLDSIVLVSKSYRSYGSVYKAVHKDSAKVVAMKVVPIDHEESELGDLKKEIQILQQCTSAFIVEYYASYLFESNMWVRLGLDIAILMPCRLRWSIVMLDQLRILWKLVKVILWRIRLPRFVRVP